MKRLQDASVLCRGKSINLIFFCLNCLILIGRGVKLAGPAQPGPKRPDYMHGSARPGSIIIGPHILEPGPAYVGQPDPAVYFLLLKLIQFFYIYILYISHSPLFFC